MQVPPQHFIRTSLATIVQSLLSELETEKDKERLIDFLERVESLYMHRLQPHRDVLQRGFDLFCPQADYSSNAEMPAIPSNIDVELEEDNFLQMLNLVCLFCARH